MGFMSLTKDQESHGHDCLGYYEINDNGFDSQPIQKHLLK